MSERAGLPMRVTERQHEDCTMNVLQALVFQEKWIDLDFEVVPEWAIIQHVTLGSTEWRSKFAAWMGKQGE